MSIPSAKWMLNFVRARKTTAGKWPNCWSSAPQLDRYFAQKDIAELHDRAAFINGILDARSFNWTQMFMDLERVLPGGVHVLSIEPKQAKGHVELKLSVGASSDETKLNFLRALEGSKDFTEVQVQTEHAPPSQTGNTSGDQKVIQLTTVYLRS